MPVRRFSTSVVAACVVVVFDDFAHEVEFEILPVRRGGVLGGLEHLWVGEWGVGESTGEPGWKRTEVGESSVPARVPC